MLAVGNSTGEMALLDLSLIEQQVGPFMDLGVVLTVLHAQVLAAVEICVGSTAIALP